MFSLIFSISFLLLNLGIFFFSNSFRWYVRLFIWDFSFCFRKAYMAVNIPWTAFATSCIFWKVVFPFSFALRYFLIFSLISLLTHWLFSGILFGLCKFVCSCFCFYSWFLLSCHCNLGKMFDIISILLNLSRHL